ncbi:hypothetical protein CPB86DRAFT_814399 [Serendipita vermifera]|nr:hypothetical protein CPB86DRAFT_814399 [Serendipita vermifera]
MSRQVLEDMILRYAKLSDPSKEPHDQPFYDQTDETYTLFEKAPKSLFHFLIVLRPMWKVPGQDLRSLLQGDRETAKGVLTAMDKASKGVESRIKEEMEEKHGFTWKIWTGFHPIPSLDVLHLHVISSDLCGVGLTQLKYYNGFNPDLGFFLPIDEVLGWFEPSNPIYRQKAQAPVRPYHTLFRPAKCWRCQEVFISVGLLKTHLQKEWEQQKETFITDSSVQQTIN